MSRGRHGTLSDIQGPFLHPDRGAVFGEFGIRRRQLSRRAFRIRLRPRQGLGQFLFDRGARRWRENRFRPGLRRPDSFRLFRPCAFERPVGGRLEDDRERYGFLNRVLFVRYRLRRLGIRLVRFGLRSCRTCLRRRRLLTHRPFERDFQRHLAVRFRKLALFRYRLTVHFRLQFQLFLGRLVL